MSILCVWTSSQENLNQEEHHIATVLKQNGYPNAFIHSSARPRPTQDPVDGETEQEGADTQRPPLVMLSYVSGASEDIRCVCGKFCLRVVFKSGRSLRSVLTKVKDTLPAEKQSKVVYQIPCSCGKTYIGEMTRRLETRMKNTKMLAAGECWRSQLWQNMPGSTTIPSSGRTPG